MAFPLLGLLALGGGALGQDYYGQQQALKAQESVRGLLGRAPETLAPETFGPPAPGAGLLADPADPRKQLEFAAGLMGLRPRDREAAGPLFEGIMARAGSAALSREGWSRQEVAAAIHEANVDRRWQAGEQFINQRFDKTHELAQQKFETDKQQFGDTQAFEKYKFFMQNAIAQSNSARAWNAERRDQEKYEYEKTLRGQSEPIKLPQGYRPVVVPGEQERLAPGVSGPPAPGQARVVAAPVRGTPDWTKAQETVDQLTLLRHNINAFSEHLKTYGTEQFGAGAGVQTQLRRRLAEQIGKLAELGTLQKSDLERLEDEVPATSDKLRGPIDLNRAQGYLRSLDQQVQMKQRLATQRFQGYGLMTTAPELFEAEDKGRAAPPAGSEPFSTGERKRPVRRRGTGPAPGY